MHSVLGVILLKLWFKIKDITYHEREAIKLSIGLKIAGNVLEVYSVNSG